MSSTSRSPDEKSESSEEPENKRAGSPGRYSIADSGDEVPPTRIDSMTRMPAVRPDVAPKSSGAVAKPPTSSAAIAASRAAIAAVPNETEPTKKKAPVALPMRNTSQPIRATQRSMPAPVARGAAPAARGGSPAARGAAPAAAPSPRPSSSSGPSVPPTIRPAGSVRPPLTSKPPSVTPPALGLDSLDEGSIAFAFDALVSEDRPSLPGTHEFDLAPVRELFAELAANHMQHVRDFMIDVKWGEVTRDWIHICVPPVRTLRRGAERLDLLELTAALDVLGKELDASNAVGGQMLGAQEKQRLLDAYGELVKILPQAFALERDTTQREAVIVQALLLQVPDVRKVTIDKLHAAGLTSLTVLFEANAHDIAQVADIPDALATRIVDRVQAYRAELKASSPHDARAAEREKLAGLNGQLKQHHDGYEEAASGWGPDAKAKKRDCFRAREETWLEISVLLARFGEVDRLQGIEKVPFAQRIAQLSEYIEEARDKYRSPET